MAFSAFERMVAMRYLRARRQEGFISVIAGFSLLGIALGVATLIIVMAVMNGFRAELLGRILGVNGHITLFAPPGRPITDYEELVNRLRSVNGIAQALPLVEGQVLATANNVPNFGQVRGIRLEDLRQRPILADNIKLGSLNDFTGDQVIIGARMAERMGVSVGGDITLLNPKGAATAIGSIPRIKTYRVAAIFNVGMIEYDSSFIYMPLAAARLFFEQGAGVTDIEVILDDPSASEAMSSIIAGLMSGRDLRVFDWQRSNSGYFAAVQVERNVMFLILTLIIIVAAFNIISSMIMLVKDKGRDIAVMRTMGATRGMIMRIFLLSGASVGVIGTALGFALGIAFCSNIEAIRQALQSLTGTNLFSPEIYFLSNLPAKVDWMEVAQVVGMALGLSILATLYPSWRAARLDPVEALRYE